MEKDGDRERQQECQKKRGVRGEKGMRNSEKDRKKMVHEKGEKRVEIQRKRADGEREKVVKNSIKTKQEKRQLEK